MNWIDIITMSTPVLVSSGLAAAAVSLLTLRKTKEIEESIRRESANILQELLSKREAKEKILHDVIGPVVMQLHRTEMAFKRYNIGGGYLETEVIKRANESAREILLTRGYMLSGKLLDHANKLIEHYDAWLEQCNKMRSNGNIEGQVWVGPQGYPFPVDAEKAFRCRCEELRNELWKTTKFD